MKMDQDIELIIELTVFNGFIELSEISPLLFVNKEIHKTVDSYIDMHCNNYFSKKILINGTFVDKTPNKKPLLCLSCLRRNTKRVNPFDKTPLCKKCTSKKLIHKTNAKQIYKLKDFDLERLSYHCYHRTNYQLGYLYDLHTVQYISLLYKIQKSKNDYKNPPKPPAKTIREARVRSIIQEQDIEDKDEVYHILSCQPIFYYIKNGSYGVRRVKKAVQEWKEFYQFIHTDECARTVIHDLNINDYFERFIQDKEDTIDIIHEKHELIMIRNERENMIVKQLEEYNIKDDYKCDAYYNFIMNPNEDLDECIKSIREYHFFIANTDYISIRKNKIDCIPMRRYMTSEQVDEILKDIDDYSKKVAIYFAEVEDEIVVPDFIKLKYLNVIL